MRSTLHIRDKIQTAYYDTITSNHLCENHGLMGQEELNLKTKNCLYLFKSIDGFLSVTKYVDLK